MTGKTSYINQELKDSIALTWNLLDDRLRLRTLAAPALLREEIDEIQKVPELINEIHNLIEEKKIFFLLTGSSARKLRKAGVNLLGGRAGQITMHPFVYAEIESLNPGLDKLFTSGLHPSASFSEDPEQELNDYIGDILNRRNHNSKSSSLFKVLGDS